MCYKSTGLIIKVVLHDYVNQFDGMIGKFLAMAGLRLQK